MPILSADDLTRLRDFYLFDHFESPTDLQPSGLALSHFNMANSRNFASDDFLQDLATRIELDKGEVLDNVSADKAIARLGVGDSPTDAQTKGLSLRQDALFRLLRAQVWLAMMNDPGFSAAFADVKERASMFASWRRQMEADTAFTARRAGGFGTIPLVRR